MASSLPGQKMYFLSTVVGSISLSNSGRISFSICLSVSSDGGGFGVRTASMFSSLVRISSVIFGVLVVSVSDVDRAEVNESVDSAYSSRMSSKPAMNGSCCCSFLILVMVVFSVNLL